MEPLRETGPLAGLARAWESLGRIKQAEAAFSKAIAARPRTWPAPNNLGVFFFRQKKYAEAEAQFRRVIELTPDDWAADSNLGNALKNQGRVTDALASFDKANSISPNYVTHQNAGTLNYFEGNYKRAAELLAQALLLNDKDYRVRGSVATALRMANGDKGRIDHHLRKAAEQAESTLAANPGDLEARSYLGTYLAQLGESARAGVARSARETRSRGGRDLASDGRGVLAIEDEGSGEASGRNGAGQGIRGATVQAESRLAGIRG